MILDCEGFPWPPRCQAGASDLTWPPASSARGISPLLCCMLVTHKVQRAGLQCKKATTVACWSHNTVWLPCAHQVQERGPGADLQLQRSVRGDHHADSLLREHGRPDGARARAHAHQQRAHRVRRVWLGQDAHHRGAPPHTPSTCKVAQGHGRVPELRHHAAWWSTEGGALTVGTRAQEHGVRDLLRLRGSPDAPPQQIIFAAGDKGRPGRAAEGAGVPVRGRAGLFHAADRAAVPL